MKTLLTTTALIALLGAAPALAEDATTIEEKPTANDVLPDVNTQAPAAEPDAMTTPDSAAAPAEKLQDQAPATAEDQAPAATEETPADTAATAPSSSEKFVTLQTDQEWMASSLIGASVYNSADENLGDINDIVIGDSGSVEAVIIGVGGFLGIGEKNVGIAFSSLNKTTDQDGNVKFTLNASKEELDQAPAFVTLVEKKQMEAQPPVEPQLAPAPEPAPAPAPEPAPVQ